MVKDFGSSSTGFSMEVLEELNLSTLDAPSPGGESSLGLRIASALKALGLVNHSIW